MSEHPVHRSESLTSGHLTPRMLFYRLHSTRSVQARRRVIYHLCRRPRHRLCFVTASPPDAVERLIIYASFHLRKYFRASIRRTDIFFIDCRNRGVSVVFSLSYLPVHVYERPQSGRENYADK